jgi:cbb3-type cytochrome oxidase cytochrome c subunit
MNKKLLIGSGVVLLAIAGLIAITPLPEATYREVSLKDVRGLDDCKMIAIEADGNKIYVVRCPNSDVSIHWIKDGQKHFTHTTDGTI